MGRVKDFEKRWLEKVRGPKPSRKWADHPVSYGKFLEEFGVISNLSGDSRVGEAAYLIVSICQECGLVDADNRWKKNPIAWDDLPAPDYAAEASELIGRGISQREAFARIAVRYSIRAASWDAALAQVKRAWLRQQNDALKMGMDKTDPLKNP